MIKLRSLLKEGSEENKPASFQDTMCDFFKSNKAKLAKLAKDDDWDEFYTVGFEKFPDVDQDDVAQAMNVSAMRMGWFQEIEETEMPEEKDLEAAAFGDKKDVGKGVKMGDYDKKQKLPKKSPTDLTVTESAIHEEWGSSDQSVMNYDIHKELGEPNLFPRLEDVLEAAESVVGSHWDHWSEYKSGRKEELIKKAAQRYYSYFFPERFSDIKRMFSESKTNTFSKFIKILSEEIKSK